jgi:hypothetical protein
MLVQAKVCKELPLIEGDGRNGHYEIHPFIVEWEDEGPRGTYTQSAKIELNAKNYDVKAFAALIGSDERIPLGISIQVDTFNEKYYNGVYGYPQDEKFKLARQY